VSQFKEKMPISTCAECGGKILVSFVNEPLALFNGDHVEGLSGKRCTHCGEVYLDDASLARYAQVGDTLVLAMREQEQKMQVRVLKN